MIVRKLALSLAVVAASGAYIWNQPDASLGGDPLAALPTDNIETGSIAPAPANVSDAPPTPNESPAAATSTPPLLPYGGETSATMAPQTPQLSSGQFGERTAMVTRSEQTVPHFPNPTAAPSATASAPITPAPASTGEVTVASAADPSAPTAPLDPGAPTDPAPAALEARLPRPRPAHQPALPTPAVVRVAMNGTAHYSDGVFTGPVTDAYYGLLQIQAVIQNGQLAGIKVLQYPSDRWTSVRINRIALPMLRDEAVSVQSASVDIISGATLTSEAFIRSLGGALRQATSTT